MTDSPYSLRKLADMFHAQGFYVLNLRLPGHGTIPAELDSMEWQDWLAAVQIGARHVAGQLEPGQPFYMLGYSNGASLALKYAMDSIGEAEFRTPDHLFGKVFASVLLAGSPGVFPALTLDGYLS